MSNEQSPGGDNVGLSAGLGAAQIEIADAVCHGPSGENWVVARVTGQHVYPAGWPPCRAEIADCRLIAKATEKQRAEMLRNLRKLPPGDERHIAPNTELSRGTAANGDKNE